MKGEPRFRRGYMRGTYVTRRSLEPPTISGSSAIELALIGAVETTEEIARAGLQSSTGEAVHQWRLRLAATRALRRALVDDYAADNTDRITDVVDRVDDATPKEAR